MTSPFKLSELLIYLLPPIIIYIVHSNFRRELATGLPFKVTLAMLLIPIWIVNIVLLSKLIYGFSIIHYVLLMVSFALAIHLYDYVRFIDYFSLQKYSIKASKLAFFLLTIFLISLIILRVITYFIV